MRYIVQYSQILVHSRIAKLCCINNYRSYEIACGYPK